MFERVVAMFGCTMGSRASADERIDADEKDSAVVHMRHLGKALRAPGVRVVDVRGVVRRKCGCLLVALSAVALVWLAADMVMLPKADSATLPTHVVGYTVRPGDTLWAYASSITSQGGDVARTVDELMALNELDSAVLVPGQRIIVPAD